MDWYEQKWYIFPNWSPNLMTFESALQIYRADVEVFLGIGENFDYFDYVSSSGHHGYLYYISWKSKCQPTGTTTGKVRGSQSC